jgi:hypothetical protein
MATRWSQRRCIAAHSGLFAEPDRTGDFKCLQQLAAKMSKLCPATSLDADGRGGDGAWGGCSAAGLSYWRGSAGGLQEGGEGGA